MIIKNIAILFLLVCSLFIFNKEKISAEQTNISVEKSIENDLEKEGETAQPKVVPFVIEENLIVFKITIKGIKDTLNFIFDTGATGCVLDSTLAAKNNIEPYTEHSTTGASGSASYKMARIEELQANGIKLNNIHTFLIDLSHLTKGISFDGIIGTDFLFNYVTKIDYDKGELIFYNNISEIKTLYKNKLTVNLDWGIPQIPTRIKLKSGEEFEGNVLMDSGAGLSFVLNSNITRDNNLLESFNPKIKTYTASLTGEDDEYESSLHSLSFNKEDFLDVPINIPLSTAGVHGMPGLLGILGNEIMKRYNWVFDYENHTAYYESNTPKDKKFSYRCTDFYIKKEDQKLLFSYVQKNSVEYKNGIKDGMEIKSINGYGIEDYAEIRQLIHKENIKLEIEYLTMDDKKKMITIKTERKM